jgi:hypothetical protein
MGALAIVKLAEKYPGQYDGALPMCGPLGGALPELQYAGDARVTFDFYFSGLLPGTPFNVPEDTLFDPGDATRPPSALFLSVYLSLLSNPTATFQWATAAQLPFANDFELFNSSLYVVGFVLRYTNDFIERVNGKIPYDNSETTYPVVPVVPPDTLNDGVQRFDADRAALNYYTRNYAPTGRIGIPVLTLHTTRDAAIPFVHESLFAAAVADAGESALLVQRPVDRWGHCAFTPAEVQTAFSDLVQWVTTGQKP